MSKKEIYETKDYEMFKKLIGNRNVDTKRIQKIKKSIKEVGYITSPILVNEKMEIIDGQGRFEALKELDMPIEYIIQPGLTIKECVAMNINQTNWTTYDYIMTYAQSGNKSYTYLLRLQKDYPLITAIELFVIALLNKSKLSTEEIRNCSLIVTEEQYQEARKRLDKIYPIILKYRSAKRILPLMRGVVQCFNIHDVDMDFLLGRVETVLELNAVPPMTGTAQVMQYIEELYNKCKRGPTLYIFTEYRKQAEMRQTSNLFKENNKLNQKRWHK